MRTTPTLVAALLAVAVAVACARTSVVGWGYSSWFDRDGAGDMGAFDRHRSACLEQAGIEDAATIAPNSPEETRFVECMNTAGWCTELFHCQKPDA